MALDFSSFGSRVEDDKDRGLDFSSGGERLDFSSGGVAERVTDTGDETARLAARFPAPERTASSLLPRPVDPLGIGSRAPRDDKPRQGLIASVSKALKPEFKSVLEDYQPSPQEQQAEIDRRLSYGAGPISQQTAAVANEVRGSRGQMVSQSPTVNKVVKAMDERGDKSFADIVESANRPAIVQAERDAKAEEFRSVGEWTADTLSAISQGAVGLVQLPINIISPSSDVAKLLRGTQKELQAAESDVLRAQREQLRERVQNEDGFFDKYAATVVQLVTSPALSLSEAAKQIPNFLGIVGAARLTGAATAGSVGLAGRVSPTVALGEAISGGAMQAAARAAGTTAGGAGASMVMAGGDAAGGVYDKLTDPAKTPLSVWQQNPDYQKLTAEGKSSKEAIIEIATTKARMAALVTAPLGLLGFMGAEAAVASRGLGKATAEALTAAGAGKMLAKDLVGEQLEEGGTQLGGNVISRTVDPRQQLSEGVPEAMATALVTSAPFSAVGAASQYQEASAAQAPNARDERYAAGLFDVNAYDPSLISPTQTTRGDMVGPSAPMNFTPADSPSAQAGLAPIVVPVPTQPETTDVSTTSLPPLAAAGGGALAGDQLGGGVGVPGLAVPDAAGLGGGLATAAAPGGGTVDAVPPGPGQRTGVLNRPFDRATDADLLARTQAAIAAQNAGRVDTALAPVAGRGGNGYQTEKAAEQGRASSAVLNTKETHDWRIEPMGDGKFHLVPYFKETTLGTQTPQAIEGQTQEQATATAGTASGNFGSDNNLVGAKAPPKLTDAGTLDLAPQATPDRFFVFQRSVAKPPAPITLENGKPFQTEQMARVYAQQEGIKDYSIVKNKNGWAIQQGTHEIVALPSREMSDSHKIASAVARLIGKTYTVARVIKGDPDTMPNGMLDGFGGNNIMVAEGTDDAPLFVAMHEAYHSLPDAERKALNKQLVALFRADKKATFLRDFQYAEAEFEEEAAAFMAQAISARADFWEQLRDKMGNKEFGKVAKIILDSLNTLLQKITGAYGKDFADEYITDVVKARDLLTDAYAKAMRDQGLTADVVADSTTEDSSATAAVAPAPATPTPATVPDGALRGKSGRIYVDTRNTGVRLHGTSKPLPSGGPTNDGVYGGSVKNIYGQGFYTTDAADIADGYTLKGAGADPVAYDIQERSPVALYDMDSPMSDEVRTIAQDMLGDLYGDTNGDTGESITTLAQVFDEARADSQNQGVSADEVQGMFDAIRDNLERLGFRGFKHIGGNRTGRKAHVVHIYWFPETDLDVTKTDLSQYEFGKAPARTQTDPAMTAVAEAEPGPQGDVPTDYVDGLVRDIDLAEEALAAIKGINLFSNLGKLKLTPEDWREIGVLPAFARGGAKAASLADRVADGAFDEYLPFDMRHDSTRFDEQESTEYIKDALRSWQKGAVYYQFEVRMELAQLEDQIAALSAELAQEKQRAEINKEIQLIANDLAREAAGDVFGQEDAAGDLAQDERATPEERLKAQLSRRSGADTSKAEAIPQTETEAFKRFSNDAPLVTSAEAETYDFQTGEKVVVEAFHGTKRPDRVGTKFLKKRATSGPMAYHTSDPTLASSYATGKADTGLSEEDQDYANWFKIKVPGSRNPVDVVRAWMFLPADVKAKIAEVAPTLRMNDDLDAVISEEGNTSGNGSYDYNLSQSRTPYNRQGNPLKALVEDWLNSGNLFNEEEMFMDVLRMAGMPMDSVTYDSPTAEYPFVYKNYIAMQKPLVTSNIPQEVVDALNAAAKTDRSRAKSAGADIWDKNTRTLKSWVEAFNEPDNKYVWTSIPDKVTEVFKSLGYDGIIDWSGKGGGTISPVYIPFEETQVKSALGNKGKFDTSKNDILMSRRSALSKTTDWTKTELGSAFGREPANMQKAAAQARMLVPVVGNVRVVADLMGKLKDGVPAAYDRDNGRILVSTKLKMTQAEMVEALIEERLHALDSIQPNKTISMMAQTLQPGGEARETAQTIYNSGQGLAPFFHYPLAPIYKFGDNRIAAELFARIGILFSTDYDRASGLFPDLKEVYRDVRPTKDFAVDPAILDQVPGRPDSARPGQNSQLAAGQGRDMESLLRRYGSVGPEWNSVDARRLFASRERVAGELGTSFDEIDSAPPYREAAESRVTRRARPQPKTDKALEKIFIDMQNARGLKSVRARERAAEHPMAAEIEYVNANFYDILEQLDDAGSIRINCK